MKFSEASVKAFRAPAGKTDHIEFDDTMPGFGLRVRASGAKYYIAQYRIGTKSGRASLGNASKVTLTDAKLHAKKVFDQVAAKINPATVRTKAVAKAAQTFERYIDPFLDHFRGEWSAKYYNDNSRALKVHFKALHGLPVADIAIENVAAELTEVRKIGTTTANRSRATLSKFFNWAIGEGICTNNPVDKTNKSKENQRERELSRAELRSLWRALASDVFSDDERDLVKLMILTLQRESQIGDMYVAEIDFKERRVGFPRERVKNKGGGKHIIPLAPTAFEIISGRALDGRTMVFGKWDTGFANYSHLKSKIDEIVKFNTGWWFHDIRRTGKTAMSENLDVMHEVSESILNHSKRDMDKVYNNANYLRQKLEALTKWEKFVMAAISEDD